MTPEEHKKLLKDILETLKSIRDGLVGLGFIAIVLWMITMASCSPKTSPPPTKKEPRLGYSETFKK